MNDIERDWQTAAEYIKQCLLCDKPVPGGVTNYCEACWQDWRDNMEKMERRAYVAKIKSLAIHPRGR